MNSALTWEKRGPDEWVARIPYTGVYRIYGLFDEEGIRLFKVQYVYYRGFGAAWLPAEPYYTLEAAQAACGEHTKRQISDRNNLPSATQTSEESIAKLSA